MRTALLCVLLTGCGGQAFTGICGVAGIGQDEKGLAYFAVHCEPKEAKR